MSTELSKPHRSESFTIFFRRSLKINTTIRFNAAKRLRHHENFSLWSISFASLILLFIPLFKPFGMEVKLADSIVNIAQVIAAATILVVSIIASGCKFGERASKMYSDGLQINSIYRKFDFLAENGNVTSDIEHLVSAYEEIIEKGENHEDIDFLFAQIKRMPDFYKMTKFKIAWAYFLYAMIFTPYFVMVAIEIFFVYSMVV